MALQILCRSFNSDSPCAAISCTAKRNVNTAIVSVPSSGMVRASFDHGLPAGTVPSTAHRLSEMYRESGRGRKSASRRRPLRAVRHGMAVYHHDRDALRRDIAGRLAAFFTQDRGGGHACHLDLSDRICCHGCDLQSRVLETASFGRPASVWFFCYAVVPHAHGWIFRPKKTPGRR